MFPISILNIVQGTSDIGDVEEEIVQALIEQSRFSDVSDTKKCFL